MKIKNILLILFFINILFNRSYSQSCTTNNDCSTIPIPQCVKEYTCNLDNNQCEPVMKECENGFACTDYCIPDEMNCQNRSCVASSDLTIDSTCQISYFYECPEAPTYCQISFCAREKGCIVQNRTCDDEDGCTVDSCTLEEGCVHEQVPNCDYCFNIGCITTDACFPSVCYLFDGDGNPYPYVPEAPSTRDGHPYSECREVPVNCTTNDPCIYTYCRDGECVFEDICSSENPTTTGAVTTTSVTTTGVTTTDFTTTDFTTTDFTTTDFTTTGGQTIDDTITTGGQTIDDTITGGQTIDYTLTGGQTIHNTHGHTIHYTHGHTIHHTGGHSIHHTGGHTIHHTGGHSIHHTGGHSIHHTGGHSIHHSIGSSSSSSIHQTIGSGNSEEYIGPKYPNCLNCEDLNCESMGRRCKYLKSVESTCWEEDDNNNNNNNPHNNNNNNKNNPHNNNNNNNPHHNNNHHHNSNQYNNKIEKEGGYGGIIKNNHIKKHPRKLGIDDCCPYTPTCY